MLKLTNTLTGSQEVFAPLDGSTVRMYTCGPTVHNHAHIGNLRTYVFEDILRRHLHSKGFETVGYDVAPEAARAVAALGVRVAASPAEVAKSIGAVLP